MASGTQLDSLESLLGRNLKNTSELDEAYRILYGGRPEPNPILANRKTLPDLATELDIDLQSYRIDAELEETRQPRITRIGLLQHSIQKPTNSPVVEQRGAILSRVGRILEAAGQAGVNIACLQEAWTMPFAFCTRERLPWTEFAETTTGVTTQFLSNIAAKYDMVIISPILERDEVHLDTVWNTAVIIDNYGKVMGKTRKNHVPRVGDFNESTYYMESDLGHPVFATEFGKIAVNICYGRHHPPNWLMYKVNGAEIVFNPSATVDSLSETMWPIEARCAALANAYYTCAINRVGTETFPNEFTSGDKKPAHRSFGHFYGSSYVAAPDGRRTPGLSRIKEGLLITDVDLNLCRQASDKLGFQMTSRLSMYGQKLKEATTQGFKPQIIHPAPE